MSVYEVVIAACVIVGIAIIAYAKAQMAREERELIPYEDMRPSGISHIDPPTWDATRDLEQVTWTWPKVGKGSFL